MSSPFKEGATKILYKYYKNIILTLFRQLCTCLTLILVPTPSHTHQIRLTRNEQRYIKHFDTPK